MLKCINQCHKTFRNSILFNIKLSLLSERSVSFHIKTSICIFSGSGYLILSKRYQFIPKLNSALQHHLRLNMLLLYIIKKFVLFRKWYIFLDRIWFWFNCRTGDELRSFMAYSPSWKPTIAHLGNKSLNYRTKRFIAMTKITSTLHEGQYTCLIISRLILQRMRNVEKIKTHILCSITSFR